MSTVLIIEDLPANQVLYSSIIEDLGDELGLNITPKVKSEFEDTQKFLNRALEGTEEIPALILLDMEIWRDKRRDSRGGYELMKQYHDAFPNTYWIAVTANELLQKSAALGEHALFDKLYELQPFDFYLKGKSNDLKDMVRRALKLVKDVSEEHLSASDFLTNTSGELDDLLYVPPDYQLYYQIRAAAETSRHIFLYGESGTGKTMIANVIYRHSHRQGKPFRVIDGKLESDLLEELLFAPSSKEPSLIDQVREGTIYIADFDQMGGGEQNEAFRLQRRLRHHIVYLGYDVRIIGGINKRRGDVPVFDTIIPEWLEKAISLDIPSLNERIGDIPTLVEIFLREFNQREGKEQPRKLVDPSKIYDLLKTYDWTNGNIYQLKIVVEEVLLKTPTPEVTVDDFAGALYRTRVVDLESMRKETNMEQKAGTSIVTEPKTPGKVGKEPLVITPEDLRRFGIR